jgi:hypothetical protein
VSLIPHRKSENNPVLKPGYSKFIPAEPLLAAALDRNNELAGWGLRCGDDGSEWSRGKLPSPPKPRLLAHPDPVSRPGFSIRPISPDSPAD